MILKTLTVNYTNFDENNEHVSYKNYRTMKTSMDSLENITTIKHEINYNTIDVDASRFKLLSTKNSKIKKGEQ